MEAILLEHSSVPSKELYNSLLSIVENGIGGSPAPVRCTKRVYYSIVKHTDWVSVLETINNRLQLHRPGSLYKKILRLPLLLMFGLCGI